MHEFPRLDGVSVPVELNIKSFLWFTLLLFCLILFLRLFWVETCSLSGVSNSQLLDTVVVLCFLKSPHDRCTSENR